jgi:hypothetical protein
MAAVDRGERVSSNPAQPGRGWRFSLSWTALIVLGIVLYECTSQPGLAAAVACAKFGWADIRAAFWLRRVDPDRPRGATCFWGYLTFGLWKVAVTAMCLMVLLGFISSLIQPKPPPAANNAPSPVLGGALTAAAIGFALSFPTAYIALACALRHRVRVWLGGAAHRARVGRFWPPCEGQINFAPYVAFTTLVLTIWLTALLFVALVLAWQPRGLAAIGVSVVLLLGLLSTLITAGTAVSRRLFARTPQECWPAEPGEVACQAADSPDGFG